MKRKTAVYVDGFNLYYGALKGTRFRWLNLRKLAQECLQAGNEIDKIHYYTARVRGLDGKNQPRDQQLYLRALGSLPEVSIHYGRFLKSKKTRRLVCVPPGGASEVEIWNTEEKGSDVNLGSHLVHHGWQGLYDVAVVISNDTDLCEPIRIVRHELNKVVGILSPRDYCSPHLKSVATFVRFIHPTHLRASQFPSCIRGSSLIVKPSNW